MTFASCAPVVGFSPMRWVMTHPGTNGYLSTWGAILAGTSPRSIEA
ncbi:hypothetical protein [Labedella endophytica]|nr:hypothetical protein [Labedella endophytica]